MIGGRPGTLGAVELPVLDEHDGVRVADRGAQQAVGVRRGRRHDHGKPRDVGQERLQALGVLAARGPAAAELRPDRQRHARLPAGHEAQLGSLVENLVEADAKEIEVHELHDRPHARHRGADGEPGHRGLGDRRVQQAVRPPVVQPAGEREHVAALAHVDAREEHVRIAVEFVLERQPDGVHRPEHLGLAVGGRLLRVCDRESRCVYARARRDEVWFRRLAGRRDGGLDPGANLGVDPVQRGALDAARGEPRTCYRDGVAVGLPLRQLAGGAIPLRVSLVVAMPSVGLRFHEDRPGSVTYPADDPRHRDGDGLDIVAVDEHELKPVPCGACAQRDGVLVGGRRELRVSVVLAEQDHRQLPQRRQVGRLVEGALRDRAVAEE